MDKILQKQQFKSADWGKISGRAEALMHQHKFGCSESLMLAFQESLGEEILPLAAVAMSGSFRGGMGGAGCVCGALAAAQMVMGAVFGYYGQADGTQDQEKVNKSRDLYKELHDSFRQAHGAVCCRSLTKNIEAGSPERKAKCSAITRSAAFIAGGIIARQAELQCESKA